MSQTEQPEHARLVSAAVDPDPRLQLVFLGAGGPWLIINDFCSSRQQLKLDNCPRLSVCLWIRLDLGSPRPAVEEESHQWDESGTSPPSDSNVFGQGWRPHTCRFGLKLEAKRDFTALLSAE